MKRKTYLDVLRILACLLVMYNHTGCYWSFKTIPPYRNVPLIAIASIGKVNVSMFFLISGVLMIGRELSWKKWVDRIMKASCALVICTLSLFILHFLTLGAVYDVEIILRGVISGKDVPWGVHLWFLYSYIGYLISLPLLNLIGNQMETKHFYLLFVIHSVFATIFPLINTVLDYRGKGSLNLSTNFDVSLMTSMAFFYPVIGSWLEKQYSKYKLKKKTVIWGGCSCIFLVITAALVEYDGAIYQYGHSLIGLFNYVYAIFLFLLVKLLCENIHLGPKARKILQILSESTFGVYLLDPFLQRIVSVIIFHDVNHAINTNLFRQACLWIIFSFCFCSFCTIAFSQAFRKVNQLVLHCTKK